MVRGLFPTSMVALFVLPFIDSSGIQGCTVPAVISPNSFGEGRLRLNRNPFEIESDLDRLNPFVRTEDERNSVLSENTTLFDEDEDIDRNLVTDSENSCDKEITLSNNNDSFEVRHH